MVASASRVLSTTRFGDLVADEEELSIGAADGEGAALSGDPADGASGGRDAAEDRFEHGAADRAASRGDRREDRRFSRALRDRAILLQQNGELQAQLAAERAARAKDREAGFGNDLSQAERDVQTAVESGDAEAIARANRRVAEIAANRTAAAIQAETAKAQSEEANAFRDRRKAEAEASERSGPTESTAAWLEANGWYGRDPRMTRQAQALHAEAVEDEGLRPDSPAYWRHIEQGLEQRFPGKVKPLYAKPPARAPAAREADGDGGQDAEGADPAAAARVPPRAASGAVPASRAASGAAGQLPAGQTLRLSPEAVSMARSMGLTPQAYAARAAALAKAGRLNAKTITGGA